MCLVQRLSSRSMARSKICSAWTHIILLFFFQAEDGIRDLTVTGVQTCALPIFDILHQNGIQVNGSFVLGFDHDGPEVFARTAEWIEKNRLECATFHILTPYPGTPLFRQMEAERRLLHKNWDLYDTAHVVFRPRRMTEQQLADGYAWCYERLFSHRSIWRRRPADWRGGAPDGAVRLLYKGAQHVLHFLDQHRLPVPALGP